MSNLEETRRDFWEAWNGLSEVHTQEALEAQSEKVRVTREKLLKVDPEFRAMIKDREDKANAEAEEQKRQIQAKHSKLTSEAEAGSQALIRAASAKASATMSMDLDEWAEKHRFKTRTSEEAKTKSKLICPVCHSTDRGNIVNGDPTCMSCMHILVPEEELKNYNRDYRRRWKKSRG